MFTKDQKISLVTTVARYEELLEDFCEVMEKKPDPAQKGLYLRACQLLHRMPLADDEIVTRILRSKGVRR